MPSHGRLSADDVAALTSGRVAIARQEGRLDVLREQHEEFVRALAARYSLPEGTAIQADGAFVLPPAPTPEGADAGS